MDGCLLRDDVPRGFFAAGVVCVDPAVTRRRSRWVRLRLAPDCEPASSRRRTGRRQFHRPVPARRRPSLRQRTGHREHQVHVQYRLRRRHQQGRRVGRGGANRYRSRSSISGPAASCRRATARISTARSTRTMGRLYRRHSGRIPLSFKAATTASPTGATLPRK